MLLLDSFPPSMNESRCSDACVNSLAAVHHALQTLGFDVYANADSVLLFTMLYTGLDVGQQFIFIDIGITQFTNPASWRIQFEFMATQSYSSTKYYFVFKFNCNTLYYALYRPM